MIKPEKLPELKPCPFCGGKAEFASFQPDYMHVHYIRCTKCDMSTGTSHEKLSLQAKKWNRRETKAVEEKVRKETAKEICVLLSGFGIDAMLEAIRETYGVEME